MAQNPGGPEILNIADIAVVSAVALIVVMSVVDVGSDRSLEW